jgi:hypothetical protein
MIISSSNVVASSPLLPSDAAPMPDSLAAAIAVDAPATQDAAASTATPTLVDAAAAAADAAAQLAEQMAELQQLLSYIFYSFSLFISMSSSSYMNSNYRNDRNQDDNRSRDEANAHRRLVLLQCEIKHDMVQDIAERAAIEARMELWQASQYRADHYQALAA